MHAVLFDLDNTLIDRDGAFRALVRDDSALLALDAGGHGDRAALLAALGLTQEELGRELASRLRPDPELLAALAELGSRVPIGIVTNGGSQTQRAKLAASGLGSVVRQVWISGEVGLAKPDPRLFELACNELGVAPGRTLFVGDHETDRAGAAAAGLVFRRAERVLEAGQVRGLP